MSRPIIVLLRHKLIVAVQAIIQADVEAKKLLACVVALLAGWEAVSDASVPVIRKKSRQASL